MNNAQSLNKRIYIFLALTLFCISVAIFYVSRASVQSPSPMTNDITSVKSLPTTQAGHSSAGTEEEPGHAQPTSQVATSTVFEPPTENPALALGLNLEEPLVASVNLATGSNFGRLQVASLTNPNGDTAPTDLYCTVAHFAAGIGICLKDEIKSLSTNTIVTLFDDAFQPITSFKVDGIPSRARVSPTGSHVAFTVFVRGHSYAGDEFSTATFLINTEAERSESGVPPAVNLEAFTVLQDGDEIDYPDFNYWGVTFSRDGDTFYATLRFNRTRNLVRGSIKERTITVLHENVECPSLSPDETRIAFKHRISLGFWQLTVMDLATFTQTPLAETRNVDVQAGWLDNDHVLYDVIDRLTSPIESIFVTAADGSGEPQLYIEEARSSVPIYRN